MTAKPQKAVLLETLFVNGGHRIQKGVEAELLCFNETDAVIKVDGCSMFLPRHLITIIPPDSPRVHKHKNKSNKRKKPQKTKNYEF